MEEIGCHFKFENISGNHYHNTNLLLSSGRNCLRYILRERNIKTLFLPYFLCESLSEVCNLEAVNIIFYNIDENFMPLNLNESQLSENTFLYYVNYYGLLRDKLNDIVKKYKYVIIDNTHDFFDCNQYDADVIYNYRKYFGVPDGACILSNDLRINNDYPIGKSLNKIIEVVSRDELGKYFHYESFSDADKFFRNEDLCYMSNFTNNYLNGINYEGSLKRRLCNYKFLLNYLKKYNKLNLTSIDLTYMYPLLIDDGDDLRNYLKENNIYSLMLWPNVLLNNSSSKEKKLVKNMVLLPIDQRYSENEMKYIVDTVDNYYQKK